MSDNGGLGLRAVSAADTPPADIEAMVLALGDALEARFLAGGVDELLDGLLVMAHRLNDAYRAASDAMADDVLDIEDLTEEQAHRIRGQVSAPAALRLASIAAEAMAHDFADGLGIRIEALNLN